MRSPQQSSDVVHVWILGVLRGFRTLCDMGKLTWGVGIAALCVVMFWSAAGADQRVAGAGATSVLTVPAVDVADAGDPAVRLGRAVPTTSTVVRTIGACVPVGLGTPNSWRAALGLPALVWSDSLYAGACAWATHLAELGGLGGPHEPGVGGETLYGSSSGCGDLWNAWYYSAAHYAVWTGRFLGVTAAVVTVSDSTGRCWAVGRVDNQRVVT